MQHYKCLNLNTFLVKTFEFTYLISIPNVLWEYFPPCLWLLAYNFSEVIKHAYDTNIKYEIQQNDIRFGKIEKYFLKLYV